MAKRYRNLIQRITAPDTMREALRLTAAGKHLTPGYLEFKEYDALNLGQLTLELADGSYRQGTPNQFWILDPKRRLISALPFRDRVAQQAVGLVVGPILNAAGEAKFTGEVRFNASVLDQPLRWSRPRMIFVCAHGDLFHESVPDDWIDQVFAVMALCRRHTFQVLTKRPERARAYLTSGRAHPVGLEALGLTIGAHRAGRLDVGKGIVLAGDVAHLKVWPLPNVWLGTSVEDQATADARIPDLLFADAAVRFISAEPMLGPINLMRIAENRPFLGSTMRFHLNALTGHFSESANDDDDNDFNRVDWVIVGGESGPGARPMHPDWARSLRDQCQAAGVAFFFKQWGEWTPGENVERVTGTVESAHWFDGAWSFGRENLARTDGHRDDEPDLYRIGKSAAGRTLDGALHDGFPARAG